MKLQLTNGYILRFDQVSRILQYSLEQYGRKRIPRPEFLTLLGMSERQFENLSSICVALGLIKRSSFVLTDLGKTITEQDIHFDNIDILWIIHYVISSEPKWIVWNRLINKVISENKKINTDIASPYYKDLSSQFSEKTIKNKLPQEIISSLNAYGEQLFSRLKIIEKVKMGEYIRTEPTLIEPLPFLYCMLYYRDINSPNATGIVIKDIINAPNSLGKVLFLPEYKANDLINRLHDMKLVRIETFGDLDQIRFAEGISKEGILKKIYGVE